MIAGWSAILTALMYLFVLFALAYWGDAAGRHFVARPHVRAAIYALSLGVYCTSWTFFGSVGIASTKGLDFLPIYIGPVLAFTLGRPLVTRIARLAKTQNITSIADFVGARYGKSPKVAALVALIALIATVPYVALQLKAMSASLGTILGSADAGHVFVAQGTANALAVASAVILALFAMAFGTRRIDATEHQDGLMLAVAAESLVKLLAFLAVGAFVVWGMFGGLGDLKAKALADSQIRSMLLRVPDAGTWIAVSLLSAFAAIILPRQFHVAIVENRDERDIQAASWLFPAYLVAINLFVVPLAVAGLLTFADEAILRDMTVLALPLEAQAGTIALLVMLGGLSAAAAMVIVAAVALSIMISNDLIMPWLLQARGGARDTSPDGMTPLILIVRRFAIALLVALGLAYLAIAGEATLDSIGLLSIAAIGQVAPAFFGGLLWPRANARGAGAGMIAGTLIWAYALLLPSLNPAQFPVASFIADGPFGLVWLRPLDLFGLHLSPFVNGALWSLCANIVSFVAFSLSRPLSDIESLQAGVFCGRRKRQGPAPIGPWLAGASEGELEAIVARYLGVARTRQAFADHASGSSRPADPKRAADARLTQLAEGLLASVIGAASARLVLSLALQTDTVSPGAARDLLDTAAASIQYNRDLLQHALDHARQGMIVTDSDLRVLFSNREFRSLFKLPPELLRPGVAIQSILHFNASRGFYGPGDAQAHVARRLASLTGTAGPLRLRLDPLGIVVEIRSARMPDGGLVTTYSDVTQAVRTEEALEDRVRRRTAELEQSNRLLNAAKAAAEGANLSKTRFLAAASHDILQPLNAARLYASALLERDIAPPEALLVGNMAASLESVEDIIAALLEISRLDAGAMTPDLSDIPASELFQQLRIEFEPMARQKRLTLVFVASTAVLRSDRRLLRRLLQNLISNALKYTQAGGVVVGCRRHGAQLRLEVWDSGLGIAPEQQARIFGEFQRLDEGAKIAPGLGLGLSIVERMAHVLDTEISLRSRPGRGSLFAIVLPRGDRQPLRAISPHVPPQTAPAGALQGLRVAVIDNEPSILDGMRSLLGGWGCIVVASASRAEALAASTQPPHAVLADYHLGNDDGLAVIAAMREKFGAQLEAALITADRSAAVADTAARNNIRILAKPLKPAALRALLQQVQAQRGA